MKTLLLIIDMQNDFCRPDGSLFVKGADEDIVRVGRFVHRYKDRIDHIIMTQDSHHVIDISHPSFWEDRNGNTPAPFTGISADSVSRGIWIPRFRKTEATWYIRELEKQGEFPHVIWPEHCIMGSGGAAIVDEIMEPVKEWARKGKYYDIVVKGTNPLTEHFGAIRANIPLDGSPETQINAGLVDKLRDFDKILVAGEAKSHCVATTIKQMVELKGLAGKLLLLGDCMSDIAGFETIALPIYDKARSEGAGFVTSSVWPLK